MFCDNYNRSSKNAEMWVLKWFLLTSTSHHKAQMYICLHVIGVNCFPDCRSELLPRLPNVEVYIKRGLKKAIKMLVQKRQHAIVEAQPFPDAIAQHEARIVNRDFGIIPMQ